MLQDHVRTELREAGLTVDAPTQQLPTKQLEYSGQVFAMETICAFCRSCNFAD